MQQISYEHEGFPEFLRSEAACKRAVDLGRIGPDTPVVVFEPNGERTRVVARDHPVLRSLLGLDVVEAAPPPQAAIEPAVSERAFADAPADREPLRADVVAPARSTPVIPRPSTPGRAAPKPVDMPKGSDGAWAWMTLPLRRYADFEGRSRRKEYWMFTLLLLLSYLAIVLVFGVNSGSGAVVIVLLALVTFIPGLAVGVRRLHDIGLTGWLMLLGLIPYVGGLILLVLMLQAGKREDNQYGSNPKFAPDASVFD